MPPEELKLQYVMVTGSAAVSSWASLWALFWTALPPLPALFAVLLLPQAESSSTAVKSKAISENSLDFFIILSS